MSSLSSYMKLLLKEAKKKIAKASYNNDLCALKVLLSSFKWKSNQNAFQQAIIHPAWFKIGLIISI